MTLSYPNRFRLSIGFIGLGDTPSTKGIWAFLPRVVPDLILSTSTYIDTGDTMATLLKRNGTYYMKWTKLGHETRKSLQTKSIQIAKKRMREEEERLYHGDDITTERALPDMTHEAAWESYAALSELKEISLQCDEGHWDRFWKWARIYTLASVTPAVVSEYKLALRQSKKFKARTINKKIFSVSKVYTRLIAEKVYAGENPFKGESPVKGIKAGVKFLPWSTVTVLLEAAKAHGRSMYLSMVLGALAGMRKMEVNRARWEHVNWDTNVLYVDGTKNDSSAAYIPLHPMLREALELYSESSGWIVYPDYEFVPGKLYRFNRDYHFKQVVDSCGIKASMHTLRHSVATHMLDKGFTLAEIAVFLRHGSLQSTQIYASLKGVSLNMDRL